MSKFQIILLGIFGIFIIAGVFVFSTFRSSSSNQAGLKVWGPVSAYDFQPIADSSDLKTAKINLAYQEESPGAFVEDLTQALSENRGPDVVIFPVADLWQLRNKLTVIPYSSVSSQTFSTTFIDEGKLLTTGQGIYGLPLIVDPMVMYANNDLLNNAGIASPIRYWDEIYTYASALTTKDPAGNITQSVMALGESRNIPHAKDILTLLMLQAGTPITSYVAGGLQSQLTNTFNLPVAPGNAALDFYTQFSNPAKPFYSWNRSLAPALTNFISGDSAFYLGYASEEEALREKNPNLNIGVVAVPQSRASGKLVTLGNLYAVGIIKNSPNQAAALTAAGYIAGPTEEAALSQAMHLPPARRDLLAQKPSNGVLSLYYDAALQAKGWIDPNPVASQVTFSDLVDSVTSGRSQLNEALSSADDALNTMAK